MVLSFRCAFPRCVFPVLILSGKIPPHKLRLSEPPKATLTHSAPAPCRRPSVPERTDLPFSRDLDNGSNFQMSNSDVGSENNFELLSFNSDVVVRISFVIGHWSFVIQSSPGRQPPVAWSHWRNGQIKPNQAKSVKIKHKRANK